MVKPGVVVAVVLCLGTVACGVDADSVGDPGGATRPDATEAPGTSLDVTELADGTHWVGPVRILVETWSSCGSLDPDDPVDPLEPPTLPDMGEPELVDSQTFAASWELTTRPPLEDGEGNVEGNPFGITAGTRGGLLWSVESAVLIPTPSDATRLYLQEYWAIGTRDTRIGGDLKDAGEQVGQANLFEDEDLLVPCQPQMGSIQRVFPFERGTSFEGAVDDDTMTFLMRGRSRDHTRTWTVEGTLTRQ